MAQSNGNRPQGLNTLLIVLVGQMGCLTLIVIGLTVGLGMWLDSIFGTKPIFTLVLLLAGIPVSVLLMVFVGRRSLERFRAQQPPSGTTPKESS
ncbi:MAG TPA: AtpZ/AtpI family protein [Anaerolineales bacterium]|nr:AtpZ/AtpI family protein [Anaerolineales bacterium]